MTTPRTLAALTGAFCSFAAFAATPLVESSPVTRCLRPAETYAGLSTCAAPGTDPEYAAAFYDWMRNVHGVDYVLQSRWSSSQTSGVTSTGDPITLTYSFPSDALGGISGGSTTQNVMNAKMTQWFGSVAQGKARVRQVFDRWQALSGLRFIETTDDDAGWGATGQLGIRGDIRIVSISVDGASNVLAFTFFPNQGGISGEMVFDSSENFGSAVAQNLFFRNVFAHEAGHGFGLSHVCPPIATKLMEPFASTSYDGPRHDDTRAVQAWYGDTRENNDFAIAPTDLGVIGVPTAVTDVSINALFSPDPDYYRFTTPGASNVWNFLLTPIGFTYDSTNQSGQSCPNGGSINTNIQQDLVLEILASDGVTVLASVNAQAAGGIETINNFNVAANTNYFIRVTSATVGNVQTQLYRIDVQQGTLPPCPGDANGDHVVNFSDLNIVLGQFGQTGPGLAGDVNGDGTVNFSDLNIVLSNFGTTC